MPSTAPADSVTPLTVVALETTWSVSVAPAATTVPASCSRASRIPAERDALDAADVVLRRVGRGGAAEFAGLPDLLQVAAGAEALSGPRQDGHADVAVRVQPVERADEGLHHVEAEIGLRSSGRFSVSVATPSDTSISTRSLMPSPLPQTGAAGDDAA